MNAIILAAMIAGQPLGEMTIYSNCFRADTINMDGMIVARLFEGTGGERYTYWIGPGGKFALTMTAPMVRGAVCVIAEGKELPEA